MTSLRRVQPRFVDWRLSRIEEEQDRVSCSSVDGASTAADCLSSSSSSGGGSVSDVDTCPPSPLPPPPPLDELEAVAFMPLPPPDEADPPPPPPTSDGSYPYQPDPAGLLSTKISPACEHIYSNVIDQETRELQEQRDALRFIKEKYDSLGKVKVERPISSMQTPAFTAPENGRTSSSALQVNEDQPASVNNSAVGGGGGNVAMTDCGRPQERKAIGETTTNFLVQCPANKSLLLASGGTVTLTARDAFLQSGGVESPGAADGRLQQLTAADSAQQLHLMQLHQLRVLQQQQQQQAHRCCCCKHQQQAQQQVIHHHHHKLQQQPQQQLENPAKSSSTSSPPSPSASSSSSSTSNCSRGSVGQHVHHHQHHAPGQPRSAAEQLVLSVPRCPLTDHELIQIDLFYRSHKTSVYVSPSVAALCFSTLSGSTGTAASSSSSPAGKGSPASAKRSVASAAPSTAATAATVVWTFAKIGVPVIVEDTGDGRRRRRVYLVLAERGTGFELWRAPIDRAADYSVHAAASVGGSTASGSVAPSVAHHVIRLPPDYSVSARLEFEDPAGADEFHRQLTSRFPPDVDDCSTSGRRKAKKIKDEQQKRKKALEKEREAALRQLKKSSSKRASFSKADISQPCCFSHVTRLERDGSTSGGGLPGSRRVVQLQGGVDPVQMRLEPGSPAAGGAAAAASMSPSGGSRVSRPYNSFKVTY